MTANELLAMPDDDYCYELLKGELIRMPPPGHVHGLVAMNIAGPLHQYVKQTNLGIVYAAETGFWIEFNPDTVRAPDVAFIARERLEAADAIDGYFEGAPDLCAEVLSPRSSRKYSERKVIAWLEAGSRMVWVANPKLKTVMVYRSLNDVVTLTENDELDGDDVIPGFRLAVAEVF
jgi:Uma2 family endonuclease